MDEAIRTDQASDAVDDETAYDASLKAFPTLLVKRLVYHLSFIYPRHDADDLTRQVLEAFWPADKRVLCRPQRRRLSAPPWSERDAILITYGNSLQDYEHPPLHILDDFLTRHLGSVINSVHVLPFFPWTSDDGFAIVDFTRVHSELGTWADMRRIAGHHKLMADLVLNHVSALHPWFVQFRQGQEPGCNYFRTVEPGTDVSEVVRPRPQPLLQAFETAEGEKHVWCTFSRDQVDMNFANPDVLIEFVRIIRLFMDQGVRTVRLDAVAFIWKEIGTKCVHLPQTHEIVRLMRTLADYSREAMVIITETNVPNRENISYFGASNEAHAVYNFALPPLALHALTTGDARQLTLWQRHQPPAPAGSFYFNFTASHDGIGVRAAEGYLTDDQVAEMIAAVSAVGGQVSMRAMSDGSERPYEINVSLWDAMKAGPGGHAFRFERFMVNQTIQMALEGIPGIYIHSLLATPNDEERMERTGTKRALNRHIWDYRDLEDRLSQPDSDQSKVFAEMKRRLAIRTRQPAFHPNATQMTLDLGPGLFSLWRQSRDRTQSIHAIHSVSNEVQTVELNRLNLIMDEPVLDLLSGRRYAESDETIELAPYQCVWLANRRG
ncbi:alpha-amylase [Notoacmeibacter marinus]|uniref:Alpha-amylase n=1 Tax=Notoacmeibacter marinus TaxID=1876515 RepID=A0A231UX03_9HYPH|nr:alpha-amylase [Notoacmeibacter marinus]